MKAALTLMLATAIVVSWATIPVLLILLSVGNVTPSHGALALVLAILAFAGIGVLAIRFSVTTKLTDARTTVVAQAVALEYAVGQNAQLQSLVVPPSEPAQDEQVEHDAVNTVLPFGRLTL